MEGIEERRKDVCVCVVLEEYLRQYLYFSCTSKASICTNQASICTFVLVDLLVPAEWWW